MLYPAGRERNMLTLKNIRKDYVSGDLKVQALRGVDITFRRSEFVAILGPSGCGKTTLLNIIGGLDRYTEGDLIIKGRSTREYTDRDWDSYRNHAVGFVFQSYNLIPHQTVLANVEMALTLSGVSAKEREARAREALNRVGLGDQLKKKPGEMSGGQMQRVAIARALVNDPEIVLADEPTGALDSETSLQIMEALKEIARDRLVIMVTHNPELAEKYATRTVRLLDGKITGDTNPCDEAENAADIAATPRTGMSFGTALRLSLNNLLTKKGRTFLVALAGSIGIIGIALILALSTGVNNYIASVEENALALYPLSIESETVEQDDSMMRSMMTGETELTHTAEERRVYSSNIAGSFLNGMVSEVQKNDLASLKEYLDTSPDLDGLLSGINYEYAATLPIYNEHPEGGGILQVNPSTVIDRMTGSSMMSEITSMVASSGMGMLNQIANFYNLNAFSELSQVSGDEYELLCGHLPESYDEVLLITGEDYDLSDLVLYTLGLRDQADVTGQFTSLLRGQAAQTAEPVSFSYDELMGLEFVLVPQGSLYEKNDLGVFVSIADNPEKLEKALEGGIRLKVSGIARSGEHNMISTLTAGGVGYPHALLERALEMNAETPAVKAQRENPDVDIFTGVRFSGGTELEVTMDTLEQWLDTLDPGVASSIRGMIRDMTEEQIMSVVRQRQATQTTNATYEGNLSLLGETDLSAPVQIEIYPKNFEAKAKVVALIDAYNDRMRESGQEEKVIAYTDYVGALMQSVTDIVNIISYVLIAFVSVSLIVSSIMIGIITYISVLERTREIGILRALGASKGDISRVFTAETFIIGLVAGLLGVGITWLITLPVNAILHHLTGESQVAATLPVTGALILVAISMILTMIAGAIPSRMAARKDPVVALRTE